MFFFSCSRKCFEPIGKDNLDDAFINFYSQFNTKEEQDLFLHGLIDVTDIVRKRPGSRNKDTVRKRYCTKKKKKQPKQKGI